MLTSNVFKENPFVNSAVIGLSNGQIVRFTSEKQYNVMQCNYKGPFSFVWIQNKGIKCSLLASKPLIIHVHADTK